MKISMLRTVTFLLAILPALPLAAQHKCGNALILEELGKRQPDELLRLIEQRDRNNEQVRKLSGSANKTTAQYPIPVVFHFVLSQAQYNQIGRDTGIMRRVRSQLECLNKDFNRQNADSSLIPAAFKPLYSGVGIQFALANTTNSNTISPGIELRMLAATDNPTYSATTTCHNVKHSTSLGMDAWDNSKYFNVWVCNIAGGNTVGVTAPPSFVTVNVGGHVITPDEKGMVLHYPAIGVREFPAQYFLTGIDKGRTMTHEMGHYFEIWHPSGDDGGLCPTNGGFDDGITDTPPEADSKLCSGGVCPTFPTTDACSPASPGVMFMNFMDYVDDRAMQMFTIEQASVMFSALTIESWSLTQHPELVKVSDQILPESTVLVSPNPAQNQIRIATTGNQHLQQIELVNTLGQTVYRQKVSNQQPLLIGRQDWAPGVYYLHCQFAEGILSKKIVFE